MIYIIVGPTGSGKTDTAVALAHRLNCPIINADAFQVYRDMNIGTAKIPESDPDYARHRLLDIVSPESTYSVKEYQEDFRRTMKELRKDFSDVIVSGGTGLYIRAAIYDYVFEETEPDDVSDLEKLNSDELYRKLQAVDPDSAEKIHPNNRKRVIRALSIARTSSSLKSESIASQSHAYVYPKEEIRIFLISPDREKLYENINARVERMFQNGLVDEVRGLLSKYELSETARKAIGYEEVIAYLNGETDLDSAKERIKQRTRNYAKRQLTFFRHQFETETFSSGKDILDLFA